MHDPFAWSFPLARLFGVNVRVHWLFPFVALGFVLHAAFYRPQGFPPPEGRWIDAVVLMVILFFVVLAHEFGHAFMARHVDGDCQEILMWPLGGLAACDVPHRPRAHFLVAAAGPGVNLLICILCALLLLVVADHSLQPAWNPLPTGYPYRDLGSKVALHTWSGETATFGVLSLPVWLARIFWVSWFLFLMNIVLAGYPLDGGRMLQAILWPSMGYRQSMLVAIFTGFFVVFAIGLYAIVVDSVLALCLALFVYVSCQRQWVVLETGGEEGVFGYDFSQGYTSLEREGPTSAPPARKLSWWQRWRQRRAAQRLQREMEQREAEERRLDELLDKIHRQGESSLSDEERRFMKRVSDRYRNRP